VVQERHYYDREGVIGQLFHKVKKAFRLHRDGMPLRKIWNVGLCMLSLKFGWSRVLGKPYYLMIEPTNVCNLRCPLCPTGEMKLKRAPGFMTMQTLREIIDPIQDSLIEINITNYGEPTMHKELPEMIRYVKDKGIRVSLGSNGHFFNTDEITTRYVQSGLDHIYISMDGTTQETFEKYRVRGNFEKLRENVARLVRIREALGVKTPEVELQFIVMRHNEHQMDEARKMARDWKADRLTFKPVSFNVAEWNDPAVRERFLDLFPNDEEHRLYDIDETDAKWKVPIENRCDYLWRAAVILWDGKIVPCCMDPRGDLLLGDAKDDIRRVWNGKRFRKLRKKIRTEKKAIPLCANCPGAN